MLEHESSVISIDAFHNRVSNPIGIQNQYGLLIPLIKESGEWHVLFEERSHTLRAQPGEICFPGGKRESGESAEECALRETCEELGLSETDITIIGPSDYILSPFRALLFPFVGILEVDSVHALKPNADEVSALFTVPLSFLLATNPEIHHLETAILPDTNFPYHKIQHGRNYPWKLSKHNIIIYEYNNRVIWGLTANLLKAFLDIIKDDPKNQLGHFNIY